MAFIDKKDPVVLNIKLTSKGRELLSKGELNFSYYGIGDSEIDYSYINNVIEIDNTYNPYYSRILKPADKNPNILSFITRTLSGNTLNTLPTIPSTTTILQNTVQPLGFFSITSGSTTFITDTDHVKQPDAMIIISGVTGGTILNINKAPTYLANVNEPSVGDYILIKWTNPNGISTTGYSINNNYPTPILIYKIHDIISGKLFDDNLIVRVDRDLPDFSQVIGGSENILAGAIILYNYINFTGSTIYNDYSTDYMSDSVLTFLQNCQCPTITFPFWNLSIIYTDEIIGIQTEDRKFANYSTNKFGGFVSYIQNQAPVYKKLGVVHYTNTSPSNTYAEELYQNTPKLDIPTIMWHKSSTKKIGVTLTANGSIKQLTGSTKSLNTKYYDLADENGYVVGKIFNDLKIFLIEDQELLFAMSYKSNRSWTLPNFSVGANDNVIVGCTPCIVNYDYVVTSPTIQGFSDATITISNIETVGTNLILQISGVTSGMVYLEKIDKSDTIIVSNLSADTYYATIFDLGAVGCQPVEILISNPDSMLYLYSGKTGYTKEGFVRDGGLEQDFTIRLTYGPTGVSIFYDDIGLVYGNNGIALVEFYPLSNPSLRTVRELSNGNHIDYTSLTFTEPYNFTIRDVSGSTWTDSIISEVSKVYYAKSNSLNETFSATNITDPISEGGVYTHVIISNYLGIIQPTLNPIIGTIEISVSILNSLTPRNWVAVDGSPYYFYGNVNGTYEIIVRERIGNDTLYKITTTKNLIWHQ